MLLEFIKQNWALILISVAFVILLKSTDLQDKSFAKRMYFLIAGVFLLSIVVFTEFYLADIGGYITLRTVLMAVRYSATPVIVSMILFALFMIVIYATVFFVVKSESRTDSPV